MRFGAPTLFVAWILLAAGISAARAQDGPGNNTAKSVLLLYAERSELPAIRAVDTGLREALAARGGVEVFSEYLDFARFPAGQHASGLMALLGNRYGPGARKPDMVVTTGHEALAFAMARREQLFPGVPITYCIVEPSQLERIPLAPDVTGVPVFFDFKRTIDLALQLQPGVREVACVFGTSEFDREMGREALAALAARPGLKVHRLDAVPYHEIIEQTRRLPPGSFVLFVAMLRDATGQTRDSPQMAGELAAASSVPVYGLASHMLGKGLIGGAMMDYSAHGRAIGSLVVARLDGKAPATGKAAASPLLINWMALEKWKIPESRLPPDAIVRFKPPSLWEEHRSVILCILGVVVMQSALITGLLLNHARRQLVEQALAESQERMELAADAANLGMWVWDVSGDDAWMTEQGRALFGFKADTPIDYAALLDRVHPEDREPRDKAIKLALETQGKYEMEYRVQTEGGGVRWVSARGRCFGGTHGKGPKLLGVSMDITDRKLADLEAAEQRAELGHLSRVALVGEMATSLAHELNQPLTAIVANASAAQRFIARGKMDPGELGDLLADIAADGKRAGEVIRGIKGMVRKVEGERCLLDLNEVVEDVLRLVRADALAHGCTLVTKFESALPAVRGDAVQLQQVLLNLIINAFDAMCSGPCDPCRLEIATFDRGGSGVEASVRDFGPGLPPEAGERVFDRFFSTKGDGMGMGLAIARSIIESHAGTLHAENVAGGGARFWFRIPIENPNPTEGTT